MNMQMPNEWLVFIGALFAQWTQANSFDVVVRQNHVHTVA